MKKLSEAFLEFIEPALEVFGDPAPRTLPHDAACAMGHVVWNAVVMESLNPGKDYLTAAKAHGGEVPEVSALMDQLAQRKRNLFADDNRLIGVYDIKIKPDGTFSMWTQIVEPNEMM